MSLAKKEKPVRKMLTLDLSAHGVPKYCFLLLPLQKAEKNREVKDTALLGNKHIYAIMAFQVLSYM